VQNGTGLFALHEMGGQESPEVVLRYAHLAAGHLAPHAERLGPCVTSTPRLMARFGHTTKGLASLQALD